MGSKKQEVERRLLENMPRLYKLAGWYASGRPIDPDDIVQLTCEQVIKYWHQWEGTGFDTWIRRITFSQARDELRREHTRQGVDVDTTLIADTSGDEQDRGLADAEGYQQDLDGDDP